jgi:predicted transcriptional regulator
MAPALTGAGYVTGTNVSEGTQNIKEHSHAMQTIPQPIVFSTRGKTISPHKLRRIWACISEHPSYSVAEIAEQVCYSTATVQVGLEILEQMGYIRHDRYLQRAREVLFPFRIIASD